MDMTDQPRIVVGVDGSEGSQDALGWALREAELRGAIIELIHAWDYPQANSSGWLMAYPEAYAEIELSAKAELADTADWAEATHPAVPLRPTLVQADAARALLDAAHGAEMLIVGSRGRGGFAGLLLGSVSQQCAHHTPCPLVIVPVGQTRV